MSQSVSPKFAARVLATQALYQLELNGEVRVDATLQEFLGTKSDERLEVIGATSVNEPLFIRLVRDVFEQSDQLDDLLLAMLNAQWSIDRLDPVLRAAMRACAYELSADEDVIPGKLISEYVQIIQGFLEGKESALANATLDALARALHPQKFDE